MKYKSRIPMSLLFLSVSLLFSASPAAADEPHPGATTTATISAPISSEVKPYSESATTVPAVQPAPPAPTVAEASVPKPDTVVIRLNAPLLSPRFSTTPLAVINDEAITFEDLKKAIGTIHTGMDVDKAAPKKNFFEVLKRLINSRLMIQEARNIGLDKDDLIKSSMEEFSKNLLRETLLNQHVKNINADDKEVEKVYRERTREWRLQSLVIGRLADVRAFEAEIKAGKSFYDICDGFVRDERGKRGGKVEDFIARDAIDPSMLVALEKLKVGEIGKPVVIENGYVIYKVEEIRSKDDPQLLEQLRQEMGNKLRVAALKRYQEALTKKYVKMKKLFETLDYENKKNKFENLLKDKRVLAEIKGEQPLTVADFSDAVASKFYHGVKRAIEGKKVNKEKKAILEELIALKVFDKEAKEKKIDQTDEYHDKVKSKEDTLLFGQFMQKIVIPEITISREETKAYYAEHAKEYFTPAAYLLDAIAFSSPEKAEEAVNRLKSGTDLRWYKSNAEGQESINKRFLAFFEGNPVTKEELPIKMQQALSSGVKGDYRVFVDGTTGYAIVIADYQPPATQPYEAVEGVIREAVSYKKLNEGIEAWAKKLRESSEVLVYADFPQQEKP
ncbi:MAG: peptidylprolyl isomerase [Desulfuromonadales bacterium]